MGSSHVDWVPPDSFDEYRLVQALGRGSMGQVWLAHDTVLDRLVAVKFIAELPAHDAVRQRFLTEARAAARVQHPNIIAVYRVGEIGPRPYLISEYVRGDSLDKIARPVAWPRLLEIAIGLARGLAAAHRQGVLHRDLKPANAIMSDSGDVKLLDFGLAKLLPHVASLHVDAPPSHEAAMVSGVPGASTIAPQASSEPFPTGVSSGQGVAGPPPRDRSIALGHPTGVSSGQGVAGPPPRDRSIALGHVPPLDGNARTVEVAAGAPVSVPGGDIALPSVTRTGAVLGTPAYMPPEAWRGEPTTPRSDVYSLGALLYELGAGAPPHRGDSPELARGAVLAVDPPPLASAAPGIDPRFAAVVDRCLRRDPTERFASGDAVREAFEALAAGDKTAASLGARPPQDRPRPRRAILVGTVVALALAVFAYHRLGGERSPPPVDAAPAMNARLDPRGQRPPGAPAPAAGLQATTGSSCPGEMVSVPAETFRMGSPEGEGNTDEQPQHEVTLPAYCIDRTEVTVAAYTACVDAGGCSAAQLTTNWTNYSAEQVKTCSRWCNQKDRPDHPINCVDWDQGAAYCAWKGKRLPTEAEWEYAARGNDGRVYPWGKAAPSAKRLNARGSDGVEMTKREVVRVESMYEGNDGWETTAPVGSYPEGGSPFGALDMAGNVWEWTADWYGSYVKQAETNPQGPRTGTSRVSRGGGWATFAINKARATVRRWITPTLRDCDLGFRCARGK